MTETNETPVFEVIHVKFLQMMEMVPVTEEMPGVLYDVVVELQGHEWVGSILAVHKPETSILAEHYSIFDDSNQDFEEWGTEVDEENFPDLFEALDARIRQDAWNRAWEAIGLTHEHELLDAKPGDLIEPKGLGERMCDDIVDRLLTGVAIGDRQIQMLQLQVEGRDAPLYVWRLIAGGAVRFRVASQGTWDGLIEAWDEEEALDGDARRTEIALELYQDRDNFSLVGLG